MWDVQVPIDPLGSVEGHGLCLSANCGWLALGLPEIDGPDIRRRRGLLVDQEMTVPIEDPQWYKHDIPIDAEIMFPSI